ncbi:MAG: histidinol-phosphatase [Thermoproteota archaeon]
MVKVNYHVHSTFSDGKASVSEIVREASLKGFGEIGFSEHLAMKPGSMKKLYYSIDPSMLGEYIEEIKKACEEYGLRVRAGLEVDYFPGSERMLNDLLESYELDFLMLSVHWIGELCIDCKKYRKVFEIAVKHEGFDKFYAKYLELLERAVETGMFDIVAHFDVPRNWGFKPSGMRERELSILEKVKSLNMAVEVSSKGLRNPVGEAYPTKRVFEACASIKIPIIFGTDAHSLEELDSHYGSILDYAKSAGYNEQALFEKRRMLLATF